MDINKDGEPTVFTLVADENNVFHEYNAQYDITIHFDSEEEQQEFLNSVGINAMLVNNIKEALKHKDCTIEQIRLIVDGKTEQ